jgi:hypothetical protein
VPFNANEFSAIFKLFSLYLIGFYCSINKNIMPSYNKQKSISTYTIDKPLLENIEDYLKQNVLEILNIESNINLNYPAIDLSVILHDSHGIEKYASIRELKRNHNRICITY